jgi:hypothetical protein
MNAEITQEEFESQWKPIPGDDFPLPACPEGMILLKAFADAHPDSFHFIRPEDPTNPQCNIAATTLRMDTFAMASTAERRGIRVSLLHLSR